MAKHVRYELSGSKALVTGAASGIGLGVATALAQAGAWLSMRASAAGSPTARWLHAFTLAMAGLVALDALVAAPLGILWLPADRLVDSLLLALILGASLAAPLRAARLPRLAQTSISMLLLGGVMLLSAGTPEPALSLWPLRGQWPKYDEVVRRTQINALWPALSQAPPLPFMETA